MITATKAVRKENSEKIDYERFESLLEGVEIPDYSSEVDEMFVVFECIDDEGDSSYYMEDRVIYLTIRIPFQEMEESSDHFLLQVDYFLASVNLLYEFLDVERLTEECRNRLLISAE